MEVWQKFITPGVIFVLTLGSGLWLSRTAKPLNALLFNAHKLIALAAVVLTVIQIVNLIKNAGAQSTLTALIVISVLGVLALFASGALMSMGKLNYDLLHTLHRVSTFILIASLAGSVYLLSGIKTG